MRYFFYHNTKKLKCPLYNLLEKLISSFNQYLFMNLPYGLVFFSGTNNKFKKKILLHILYTDSIDTNNQQLLFLVFLLTKRFIIPHNLNKIR